MLKPISIDFVKTHFNRFCFHLYLLGQDFSFYVVYIFYSVYYSFPQKGFVCVWGGGGGGET